MWVVRRMESRFFVFYMMWHTLSNYIPLIPKMNQLKININKDKSYTLFTKVIFHPFWINLWNSEKLCRGKIFTNSIFRFTIFRFDKILVFRFLTNLRSVHIGTGIRRSPPPLSGGGAPSHRYTLTKDMHGERLISMVMVIEQCYLGRPDLLHRNCRRDKYYNITNHNLENHVSWHNILHKLQPVFYF